MVKIIKISDKILDLITKDFFSWLFITILNFLFQIVKSAEKAFWSKLAIHLKASRAVSQSPGTHLRPSVSRAGNAGNILRGAGN